MLTLNNPLVLIAGKVLGVGFEISFEHTDGTKKFCIQVEAVAWSWCKEWAYVG